MKRPNNPISNQYFSLLPEEGAHEYRVCRHYGQVFLIGYRRRIQRPWSPARLERERLLVPNSERWKYILRIATGQPKQRKCL